MSSGIPRSVLVAECLEMADPMNAAAHQRYLEGLRIEDLTARHVALVSENGGQRPDLQPLSLPARQKILKLKGSKKGVRA